MHIVYEIGLRSIEIMTLVFGILGMSMSLLLLFAPSVAKNLSSVFNRSVDVQKRLAFLDKDIRTEELVYGHPVLVGGLLVAGSVFALLFFAFKLHFPSFAQVFLGSANPGIYGEIIFEAVVWVGKLSCVLGLIFGACLLLAPQKLRAVERWMNAWFETRFWVERLERPSLSLDAVFFRYPVFFGLAGGAISCLLIVLSILNLLC
jgi:hypothetical protein